MTAATIQDTTPEQVENCRRLGIFLLALATGQSTAYNSKRQPLPPSMFASPHAGILVIMDETKQDLATSVFGELASHPITVDLDKAPNYEHSIAAFGLTADDIEILRHHYNLTTEHLGFLKKAKAERAFTALLKRVKARLESAGK